MVTTVTTSIAHPSLTARKKLLKTYNEIEQMLVKHRLQPQLQHLDNKVSHLLKEYVKNNNIEVHLTPVGQHCINLTGK